MSAHRRRTWRDEVTEPRMRPGDGLPAWVALKVAEVSVVALPEVQPGKTVVYDRERATIYVREVDDLLWRLWLADQRREALADVRAATDAFEREVTGWSVHQQEMNLFARLMPPRPRSFVDFTGDLP